MIDKIRRNSYKIFKLVPAALTVLLVFMIIVPLGAMFLNIDSESISEVLNKNELFKVIGNSVLVSFITMV
ncbi:MAG: hypothetical protein IKZ06_01735, partial [Oscillospiraceae bacterium]|nr:hypothetical protein [Oscillospiraceae bacterium]